MDPRKFDGMIQKLSASLSRRKAVGGSVGAAVLAAVGLSEATSAKRKKNEVQAEGCIATGKKCPAKRLRGKKAKKLGCDRCCQNHFETITKTNGKKVRKCTCQQDGGACVESFECCTGVCDNGTCGPGVSAPLAEEGSGTLTRTSADGCEATQAGCNYTADGVIAGTPVNGTFSGSLTATNFQPGDPPNFTADASGTLTLVDTGSGGTLDVVLDGELEGVQGPPGTFAFSGTYTITGGTDQFDGATGTGVASISGQRDDINAQVVNVSSLTLTGSVFYG